MCPRQLDRNTYHFAPVFEESCTKAWTEIRRRAYTVLSARSIPAYSNARTPTQSEWKTKKPKTIYGGTIRVDGACFL